ncbi:MAG: EndoU domain-containing protein [Bacteroidia bacterium]|nr:EndoU domain-containing protein [Bacteroidia bacterium]MDW8347560.1 EndoU domain-containing protein [Bacteroidia bacterium]
MFNGSVCRVKTCPPKPWNYKLHNVSKEGFNHIFIGNFKENGECSGCHHIAAQECGYARIKKIEQDKNEVFTAEVIIQSKDNKCYKKYSTFFPEKWSIQTTLDKIEEAYKNSKLVTEELHLKKRHIRMGKTAEGITIKLHMDNFDNKKIFSAYPILKKQSTSDLTLPEHMPIYEDQD